MKALLIPAIGEIVVHQLDDTDLLANMQHLVNGYIEIVRPPLVSPNHVFVVNEDGLNMGLPVNLLASWLYGTQKHGHPVVGDVLVMAESGADFCDMRNAEPYRMVYQRLLDSIVGVIHE